MVKKKSGRELNPADAFRKSQKAKEMSRNKKGRQMQRDALAHRSEPEVLKEQLREILDAEEQGVMNPTLRLRKKTLQQAYEQALKHRMEEQAIARRAQQGTNAGERHNKVNVLDIPLPEVPRFRAPHQLAQGFTPAVVLPPPPGPPPARVLPPPPGPPPARVLPPPPGPPPARVLRTEMASVFQGQSSGPHQKGSQNQGQGPTITGKSTVAAVPKAQHDKKVLSMVPSSLIGKQKVESDKRPSSIPISGFGLVPSSQGQPKVFEKKQNTSSVTAMDKKYNEFLESMKDLNAL